MCIYIYIDIHTQWTKGDGHVCMHIKKEKNEGGVQVKIEFDYRELYMHAYSYIRDNVLGKLAV